MICNPHGRCPPPDIPNAGRITAKEEYMKKLRIAGSTIALALILGLTGCGLAKDTKVAEAEAERFHQRWNANEFQAVFDDAHMEFRDAQPAAKMVVTLQVVKQNYGQLKSTKRRSWGFHSDKGITEVNLAYDSAYDHGAAVEEFTFRMTGEKALLLNYNIASPETYAKREAAKKAASEEKQKAEEAERKAKREANKKP